MNEQLTYAILQFGPGCNTANHPAAYLALARGYLEAGDALVDRLPNDLGTSYHPLVMPIIFLYRHAIELSLKALIRVEREKGVTAKQNFENHEHGLAILLRFAAQHLPPGTVLSEPYRSVVGIFDTIDHRSYDCRYPTATDGRSPSRATWSFEVFPFRDAISAAREEISGKVVLDLIRRSSADEERQRMEAVLSVMT